VKTLTPLHCNAGGCFGSICRAGRTGCHCFASGGSVSPWVFPTPFDPNVESDAAKSSVASDVVDLVSQQKQSNLSDSWKNWMWGGQSVAQSHPRARHLVVVRSRPLLS